MNPNTKGTAATDRLPAELLAEIFSTLSYLPDVLRLGAASKRFRAVLLGNAWQIYASVAPKSITCERFVRGSLNALKARPLDAPITTSSDIAFVLRYATMAEEAAHKFEQEVVPRLGHSVTDRRRDAKLKPEQHPPQLTERERRRFIRTYHLLLRFFLFHDQSTWLEQLNHLSLKALYLLLELSRLNQYLPGEVEADGHHKMSHFARVTTYQGGAKRGQLQLAIQEALERKFESAWSISFIYPWLLELQDEGALGYLLIWDHSQSMLQEICCAPSTSSLKKRAEVISTDIWYDSEDEV